MSDRREDSLHPSPTANPGEPSGVSPTADRQRVLLLEFRLEQLHSQLQGARTEADQARTRLAESTTREAEQVDRAAMLHRELADARAEVAVLHQRLERSEAMRAELEGHLFESGARGDTRELIRLRRELFDEKRRSTVRDRELERLRERVEDLLGSRDLILSRVAEWQQLVREDGPEAADLAEYMSELQREVLQLEDRGVEAAAREADLRERLILAGVDPDSEASIQDGKAGDPAPPLPPPEPAPRADAEAPRRAEAGPSARVDPGPGSPVDSGLRSPVDSGSRPTPQPAPDVAVASEAQGAPLDAERLDRATDAVTPTGGDGDRLAASTAEHAPGNAPQPAPEDEGERTRSRSQTGERVSAPLSPPATSLPATVASDRGAADALVAALASADLPALRSELLLRIGRTGGKNLPGVVRPWIRSPEPAVRAAAYEALGRLLDRDPESLRPDVVEGLSDEDPRVRRRVVLAASTARGLPLRTLLAPLREDPDPQVRRVVREVLRHAPPMPPDAEPDPDPVTPNLAATGSLP
jgi:hypothetical protein